MTKQIKSAGGGEESMVRRLPANIVESAEQLIQSLERGVPFHIAQKETGMLNGQVQMIMDNDEALYARIEKACTTAKRVARHIVLQSALHKIQNGIKHQTLDKDGDVVELTQDVSVRDHVALLGGLDKDFSKAIDQQGGSAPQVVMNFNLGADVMAAIRMGNSDIVDRLTESARNLANSKIVDVHPIESKPNEG